MEANVGSIDRWIRIVVGIAILGLYFQLDGNYRYWALLGLVPLGTGLIGWCPAYMPFGFSTRDAGR